MLKKLPRYTVIALALMLAVSGLPSAAAPAPEGARAVVEQFHSELMEVMQAAGTLGMSGRFARIEPQVAGRFNVPLMAALTTGRYWRAAQPDERKRLVTAFRRFSAATYAARFSGFSGQSFETVGAQPGPRQTRLVRTRINRPDDTPVSITYVMRPLNDAWKIVDVLVDNGISELATRRSEYRSVLADGGIDALVRLLDSKTKQLLAE